MEFFIIDPSRSIDKVVGKLDMAADKALDNTTPLVKIAENMFQVEAAVFASQGRRGGGSWKPLNPDYAKRKGTTEILKGTRDESLFRSLTEPGAEFNILHIDRTGIEFGTDRPFAYVHQEGSKRNPRRPFIRFTQFDYNRWNRIITDHLMEPFKV